MVNSSKDQTGEPTQLNYNKHIVLCSTHLIVLVSTNAQGSQEKKNKERSLHGVSFLSKLKL